MNERDDYERYVESVRLLDRVLRDRTVRADYLERRAMLYVRISEETEERLYENGWLSHTISGIMESYPEDLDQYDALTDRAALDGADPEWIEQLREAIARRRAEWEEGK